MKKILTTAVSCGLLMIIALSVTGCATNAATGKTDLMLVSEEDESQLSAEEHTKFVRGHGLYSDTKLQDYVQRVGKKVAGVSERKNIPYQFFVLDQTEVNAFALPNGNVYVTRGLLAYLGSEAELAAVLSHEVAHVAARHSSQLMSDTKVANAASMVLGVVAGVAVGAATGDYNLAQSTMNLTSNVSAVTGVLILGNYSREHELEADQLGTNYLTRAGYPAQAMVQVLDTMQSIEKFVAAGSAKDGKQQQMYHQAFASHPALETRIEKAGDPLPAVQVVDSGHLQTRYLEQTTGLVFNALDEPSTAQGALDTWLNRESLFRVYLPKDWKVIKSEKDVVLLENAKDQVRTDFRLLPPQSDHDPERFFTGPQVGATAIKDIKNLPHIYHKKPAFSAFADLKTADADQRVFLGVLFHDTHTILVTGTHKDPAWLNSHRYVFDAQTNMTKLLTQDEYNKIRIKRIQVVKAKEGDTYSSLAKESPLGAASENYLRLINHQYPTGEPAAEQSIKIVIGD